MVIFKKEVLEDIIKHAKEVFPIEACGYIGGIDNKFLVNFRMKNIDNKPDYFSFDVNEQFQVLKKTRSMGLKILGVYHSHPYSEAVMSSEDIRLAYDESIYYILFSLLNGIDVKVYKVKDGKTSLVEFILE
jgi:proteasome lid subunit RPN8/RPN11